MMGEYLEWFTRVCLCADLVPKKKILWCFFNLDLTVSDNFV